MSNTDKDKVEALRLALTMPDVHDSDAVVATWGELRALLLEAVEAERKDAEKMRELLLRLRQWDAMDSFVGDGEYRRKEIDAAIAAEGK